MRVGACQTPDIIGDIDAAVRLVGDFARQADAADVDLLLLSECFLQGYRPTTNHVEAHALDLGSPGFGTVLSRLAQVRQTLVLGMIERAAGDYHNTAVVIAGGRLIGRYRNAGQCCGLQVGGEGPGWEGRRARAVP